MKENSPQIITKKNLSDAKNQNSVNPKPVSGFPVLKSLPMSQVDIKNVITATNPLNRKFYAIMKAHHLLPKSWQMGKSIMAILIEKLP